MIKKIFHSGNIIIFGFACCAMAMLYLAYLTTTVDFDMSVEGDYYEQEVLVNNFHNAQRNGNKLGADFKIIEKNDSLILSLPPRLSHNLKNGSIQFYCFSNASFDANVELIPSKDGIYSFDKKALMKGKNYKVKVSFESDGIPYYKEEFM